MRAAYECFRTGAQPDAILQAARGDQQGHDAFYALLYVGLWQEAQGDAQAAQAAITQVGRGQAGRDAVGWRLCRAAWCWQLRFVQLFLGAVAAAACP